MAPRRAKPPPEPKPRGSLASSMKARPAASSGQKPPLKKPAFGDPAPQKTKPPKAASQKTASSQKEPAKAAPQKKAPPQRQPVNVAPRPIAQTQPLPKQSAPVKTAYLSSKSDTTSTLKRVPPLPKAPPRNSEHEGQSKQQPKVHGPVVVNSTGPSTQPRLSSSPMDVDSQGPAAAKIAAQQPAVTEATVEGAARKANASLAENRGRTDATDHGPNDPLHTYASEELETQEAEIRRLTSPRPIPRKPPPQTAWPQGSDDEEASGSTKPGAYQTRRGRQELPNRTARRPEVVPVKTSHHKLSSPKSGLEQNHEKSAQKGNRTPTSRPSKTRKVSVAGIFRKKYASLTPAVETRFSRKMQRPEHAHSVAFRGTELSTQWSICSVYAGLTFTETTAQYAERFLKSASATLDEVHASLLTELDTATAPAFTPEEATFNDLPSVTLPLAAELLKVTQRGGGARDVELGDIMQEFSNDVDMYSARFEQLWQEREDVCRQLEELAEGVSWSETSGSGAQSRLSEVLKKELERLAGQTMEELKNADEDEKKTSVAQRKKILAALQAGMGD
ncbi:hypothetical protein K402DRAFT_403092 [Aulographum hederae CBS 113979]|uniref:Uncharacterized protein n=1 Tax=Aulographum hederae CBS 113979 TaxID=1176131 RepID=A0A6G1H3T3_9PEZI|nr:hypothetical protein K402DRAFT_403092 [Aulographum hederae CBS 113979]